MPKYEDGQSDGDESAHSLESEYGGPEVPIKRTPRAKKAPTTASQKLRCSTLEKNIVSRLSYNDYMAYHYAFRMQVVIVHEPNTFAKST